MQKGTPAFFLLALWLAATAVRAAGLSAVENPPEPARRGGLPATSIRFRKEFKQGQYERLSLWLNEKGQGKFEGRLREGDPIAREFELPAETMRQLLRGFEAMQFLNSTRDYESHLKVADMGRKTLRLEQNGRAREVQFNYSTDKQINTLADFLGGVASTELRLDALESTIKYDKLGLPDQLHALQNELKNHWLAAPELLLPVLRKIANNPATFNIVQRKAHQLILQIESAAPFTLTP